MKSRLVAIGVAQGDAFFIERRDGFSALVDGGRSVIGFPEEFQRATKRDNTNVVICTHNDADHANGIIGFLQSGLRCKEVWLPASWTDRLRDLFRPDQFTSELADNVMELDEREASNAREGELLERVAVDYQTREEARSEKEAVDAEGLVEGTLDESSDDQIAISHYPLFCWNHDQPFHRRKLWAHDRRFRLFAEAIAAGDRIRQITRLAFHRGCRIRWFEYSSSDAAGGMPRIMVPVNAREVLKVTVNKSTALMYLALTVTNRQSLVFCSPRDGTVPPILFTADSNLSFLSTVPWSAGMVVTAPHHGSESNAAAYKRFRCEMSDPTSVVWIRSDGKFKSRPGPSFLDLRASNVPVFCTLCRRASQPKQNLVFEISRRRWNPVGTRACLCT